jgi:hypothetical protein
MNNASKGRCVTVTPRGKSNFRFSIAALAADILRAWTVMCNSQIDGARASWGWRRSEAVPSSLIVAPSGVEGIAKFS